MRISSNQTNRVVGTGISTNNSSSSTTINGKTTTTNSSTSGRDTRMEGKLKALGLSPEQNKTVMETLKNGKAGSAALGEELQSKLKAAGLSDDKIKSVLSALNGGKAKGIDSSSASSSSSSTSSVDDTSSASSASDVDEADDVDDTDAADATSETADTSEIAAKMESVLKSLGLSETQNKAIMKALNNGLEKGSSSNKSNGSVSSFQAKYNSDSFEV
jgi:trimeric autotransporter adhesin